MADKNFSLLVELKADIEKFKRSMDGAKSTNSKLISTFKSLAPAIGAAFVVKKVVDFGKELSQLYMKTEGVRAAFDQLNNPRLLHDLREATKGTISDFELMRNTVKAKEFGIPLEKLGVLMKFAQQQASKLGESTDSMLDSLIGSMSTQSKMRLDNLGISMSAMTEEMNKGKTFAEAAFTLIAEKTGEAAEETNTHKETVERLRASFTNLKETIADDVVPASDAFLKGLADGLDDVNIILRSQSIPLLQKFFGMLNPLLGMDNYMTALEEFYADYNLWTTKELEEEKKRIEANIEQGKKLNAGGATIGNQPMFSNKELAEQAALIKEINEVLDKRKPAETPSSGSSTKTVTKKDDLYGDFMKRLKDDERILSEAKAAAREIGLGWADEFEKTVNNMEIYELPKPDVKPVLEEVKKDAEEFTDEMNAMIKGFLVDSITSLAEGIGAAFASGDFENALDRISSTFADFISTMGKMFVAFGVAELKLFESLSIGQAIGLIAAGSAMVAIGGAIKATHSSFVSGGGVGGGASGGYSSGVYNEPATVVFEIEGDKLKGVLQNYDRRTGNYR
jgi:hypothetical protein